jgi:hypothetical protein
MPAAAYRFHTPLAQQIAKGSKSGALFLGRFGLGMLDQVQIEIGVNAVCQHARVCQNL